MAHEVKVRIADQFVLHKDIAFEVKRDKRKLGTVLISKGNIEWLPAGNYVHKKRLPWSKFAELMDQNSRDVRIK